MNLLKYAIQQKMGSAIAASYGQLDQIHTWPEIYEGTTSLQSSQSVDAETVFDLASLTKILCTTSIYMRLFDAGMIDLNSPLSQYLPEETKKYSHLKDLTVCQLLSHTSGLPAWKPFYEEMRTEFGENLPYLPSAVRKQAFFEKVFSVPLENPSGGQAVYSDLGFLILGYLAEKILNRDLQKIAHDLWESLSIAGLHFREVTSDAEGERYRIQMNGEKVAVTEVCPWRGLIQGQVHDDNAWSMGGVAGHAGVFGRLSDVKAWADALISGNIASFATLERFSKEVILNDGRPSGRALGFDLPALDGSGSTGFAFSPASIGHLGFTGTSVWLDLDRNFGAILLTNRVHPDRNDIRIRQLRRAFHTLIG